MVSVEKTKEAEVTDLEMAFNMEVADNVTLTMNEFSIEPDKFLNIDNDSSSYEFFKNNMVERPFLSKLATFVLGVLPCQQVRGWLSPVQAAVTTTERF